jgi:NADH:ubiquinone reductase (H+-translocating)
MLGVQLRLGRPATRCDESGVEVDGDRIEARTIIWAAGVMASPAGRRLGVETDRVGRVEVRPDLSIASHPEIFLLGDTAHVAGADGRPLPGVATVAKQQGAYLARLIKARLRGKLPPFRYRSFGSMATIGRKSAVVEMGRFRVTGLIAWLIWSTAHVYYLIGFRNRFAVMLNWSWNYITFGRGARLITGLTGSKMSPMEDAGPEAPSRIAPDVARRLASLAARAHENPETRETVP